MADGPPPGELTVAKQAADADKGSVDTPDSTRNESPTSPQGAELRFSSAIDQSQSVFCEILIHSLRKSHSDK